MDTDHEELIVAKTIMRFLYVILEQCNLFLVDVRTSALGILTHRRYTQREFKLKFSALVKDYDGK